MSILSAQPVDAGLAANPVAGDPSTAPAPAISSPENPPPSEASATSATPVEPATVATTQTDNDDPDAAFNALADRVYGTGAGATKKPADSTATATEQPPASTQEAPKPGEPPPAEHQDKDLDPTEQESKSGLVPVKKLTRALAVRRESLKAKAEAEAALQSERAAFDRLIDRYEQIGVKEDEILPLLSELEAADKGQPLGAILQRYVKIPPAQTVEQGIPLAEVEALVQQLGNVIDPDPVIAAFRAKHTKATPPPVPAPTTQAQPTAAIRQPAPRPAPLLDQRAVLDYAANLMDVITTIEGKEFADRVFNAAEPAFKAEMHRLKNLGVEITTQVAQRTFKQVQAGILARERRPVVPPPTPSPKPSAAAPPSIDPNDPDAEFKRLTAKRYGVAS